VSVPVGDVPERLAGVAGCEVCGDDRPDTIAAALERVLRRGGRVAGRAAIRHLDERLLAQQMVRIYERTVRPRTARATPRAMRRQSAPSPR
jgi:hypothetical protein